MNDSINSQKNTKAIFEQKYKYEYAKKSAIDSVKNAKASLVKDAQLAKEKAENKQHLLEAKQQKQFVYFLFGGLVLVFVSGVIILRRFRIS